MTPVFELASRVVDESAAAHPIIATYQGVPGFDHLMSDWSPGAEAARHAQTLGWLAELDALPVENDDDRLAAAVLRERLGAELAPYETGEHLRSINVLGSPLQYVRNVFTVMPASSEEHWRTIATRLEAVPWSLETLIEAYAEGIATDLLPARRQVLGAATAAAVCAGLEPAPDGSTASFFDAFVTRYDGGDAELVERLRAAAADATSAYADLARWLREVYAPAAAEADGVGRERYVRMARTYLGADIDPEETYAWAWGELSAINARMTACASRLYGGVTPQDAQARLDVDPAHTIVGAEETRLWLQGVTDRTTAAFNGRYFDIPEAMLTCEAVLAPPGSAAAPYYTGPSEDFSRPGRTWLPVIGEDRFRTWWLLSVWHHEAVPGHHLQIAYALLQSERLSRFQRMTNVSGHAEGWALYAERLMDELGFYADPADELGFLSNQAMRAVRVVIDIGLHLGLEIPADADPALLEGVPGAVPGAVWEPDLAREFLRVRALQTAAFASSEVDRYLGLPGQAICYKVGEREWLGAREDARTAAGDSFDLKAWHMKALALGPVGLAVLRSELVSA
jgi:uncharacterized protein (DUF885 family)